MSHLRGLFATLVVDFP